MARRKSRPEGDRLPLEQARYRPDVSVSAMHSHELQRVIHQASIFYEIIFLAEKNANHRIGPFTIGTLRGSRAQNQDRAAVLYFVTEGRRYYLAAIADGIASLPDGAQSASWTLAYFLAAASLIDKTSDFDSALTFSAELANQLVFQKYGGASGSTLVASGFLGKSCITIHAGDSRGYIIRQSSQELQRITRDDSMAEHLRGRRNVDESLKRSRGLLQYVGMGNGFRPHLLREALPSYVLLATDGLDFLDSAIFGEVIDHSRKEGREISRLLTICEWAGGKDNATAIGVDTSYFPDGYAEEPAHLTLSTVNGTIMYRAKPDVIPTRENVLHIEEPVTKRASKKARTSAKRNGIDEPAVILHVDQE